MKFVCGVVVKVRDEQDAVEESLLSLLDQSLKPFIVVVNDGSVDKTEEIASKYADAVISLPRHEESWVGKPELAKVVNAGLDVLKDKQLDFVMFADGENLYPPNYIKEITKRMKNYGIVLASGVVEDEKTRSLSPRGGGRVVDAKWFKEVEFKYPENYGHEIYLVYKALSQGKKVVVFPDLKFKLRRKTRLYPKKAYLWGKAMKAANYWWLYAFGRAFLFSLRSPRNGFELLRGYLSHVEKYKDIENFVPAFQRRQIWKRVKETLHI